MPVNILASLWAGTARAGAPLARVLLRRRAASGKEVPARLAEREGIDPTPRPAGTLIWLHAASVGETQSVLPVIAHLVRANVQVLLTTGTVTSARLAEERLQSLGLHTHVKHRFAPLDIPPWVVRFLDHWRPDAAGFVESELWPNVLASCQARRIPLLLINARLSPRSFARWRWLPGLARHMLEAVVEIQAQSGADAERFHALGAARVSAPGNLKFAASQLPVDEATLASLRATLANRPAWVAASTHPGEEELIFAAHRALAARHPDLLTILVPRHPERGPAIAEAAKAAGLPIARRGAGEAPPAEGIWLADTLGELGLFYRLAPIAFVGRSLIAPGGGQNPLEPARLGCAVAVGPHVGNFPEAVAVLEQAGALTKVNDTDALVDWVETMLRQADRRAAMGAAGQEAAARHETLPALVANTLLRLGRAA